MATTTTTSFVNFLYSGAEVSAPPPSSLPVGGFMARSGTQEELDFWCGRIDTDGLTREQVTLEFLQSQEFVNRVHFVARAFEVAFDRNFDNAGLDFWVNSFDPASEQSRLDLATAFYNSSEFDATRALDDDGYVRALYDNMGRDAADLTDPEVAFWTDSLSSGETTREQVLLSFIESEEAVTNNLDQIAASTTYWALFDRPATAEEIAAAPRLFVDDAATSEAFLAGLLADPEYVGPNGTEINGTDNADTIDATFDPPVTDAPETINGLGGNDTIDGLGGNDTITGGQADDNITGGAGSDTFVYTFDGSGSAFVGTDGEDTLVDMNATDGDVLRLDDSSNTITDLAAFEALDGQSFGVAPQGTDVLLIFNPSGDTSNGASGRGRIVFQGLENSTEINTFDELKTALGGDSAFEIA